MGNLFAHAIFYYPFPPSIFSRVTSHQSPSFRVTSHKPRVTNLPLAFLFQRNSRNPCQKYFLFTPVFIRPPQADSWLNFFAFKNQRKSALICVKKFLGMQRPNCSLHTQTTFYPFPSKNTNKNLKIFPPQNLNRVNLCESVAKYLVFFL
jgi:hypothetical protein